MPKLRECENEMASIRDKLFIDLIKGIVTWQLPTISAAYFMNIGNFDALALFAAGLKTAAIAAAGVKGSVPALADYIGSKRAAKRKHAVSYCVIYCRPHTGLMRRSAPSLMGFRGRSYLAYINHPRSDECASPFMPARGRCDPLRSRTCWLGSAACS